MNSTLEYFSVDVNARRDGEDLVHTTLSLSCTFINNRRLSEQEMLQLISEELKRINQPKDKV